MQITIDRDSVAAGDDADRHDYTIDVSPDTTVDEILRTLRPDVSVGGQASWLVRLGSRSGPAIAVYAADFGMHVSPDADVPVSSLAKPAIHFDYWAGAPPELLLESLKRGEEPDRQIAQREGWRRQYRERLAAAQAKQATAAGGLLSPEFLAAITALEARIEVHVDDYARITAADGSTYVVTSDRNYWVWIAPATDDGMEFYLAWFTRPSPAAEPVLTAILGGAWRNARHLSDLEAPPVLIDVRPPQRPQWTWTDASGEHTVKNWRSPEDAFRYAPFATMTVDAVAEHFTGGSHGTDGAPSA